MLAEKYMNYNKSYWFSFSVIIFSLSFAIAEEIKSEPDLLLKTAKESIESGDVARCENLLQLVIQSAPNTPESVAAHQELAVQYIQSKRNQEAEFLVEDLKKNYSAFSETADSLYEVAQNYRKYGLPEKAIGLHRYNSAAFKDTQKGMWSQGAIIHYYIENKDFDSAQKEFLIMMDRFKDQVALPQEIHQFAEKYRTTNEAERALEMHRYNVKHSPTSSMYTMWSEGAIVHHFIRNENFKAALEEFDVMVARFRDQPTLPKEIHLIAGEFRNSGQVDQYIKLHRYNAEHSPVSSMYTMWSQGALVHYYIEEKDFISATKEYEVMISRFKNQPTLPEEIHMIAGKFRDAGQVDKFFEINQYNMSHSPVSSKYAMWSQGAIVNYYIEQKEFYPADYEYKELLSRFKDQPTLPQEIYQFALKYQSVGETNKSMELHRYNAEHSPVSSKYAMWSQGALINQYIENKNWDSADQEFNIIIERFADQPTLSQEIHQIAEKYKGVGQTDKAFKLHQYNVMHSPNSSQYTMWSQGAIIHYYINQKEFESAQREYELLIQRFQKQESLPQEIYLVAGEYLPIDKIAECREICEYGLYYYPTCSQSIHFQEILIDLLLAEKKYDQAHKDYADFLSNYAEHNELGQTVKQIGEYCCQKGENSLLAITFYDEYLNRFSSSPMAKWIEINRISSYLDQSMVDEALSAANDVISKYSDQPDAIKILLELGSVYQNNNLWAQSLVFYENALERGRNSSDVLDAYGGIGRASVWLKDDDRAQKMAEIILRQYKDIQRSGYWHFMIGEEYYLRADEALRKNEEKSSVNDFKQAVSIWKHNIDEIDDSRHKCLAYYYSGIAFQNLSEHKKAMDCFQYVVNEWPQFERRWHALSMLAECYGILKNKKIITPSMANKGIMETYKKMIKEFPALPQTEIAKEWMESNSTTN